MKQANVVLVGIGGYGGLFVREIFSATNPAINLVGAVEPYPERSGYLDDFNERNIPIYKTMEEFYKENNADLAVIATPIFLHTEHILSALNHGSNVLCEKPLCADENDIDVIREAKKKSGKFVCIGYQWSYSPAITKLKSDILNGEFGALKEMKTLVLRPRTREYFERGVGWAGKIKTSDGRPVYDSVANNSAAHYLFNMLYIIGEEGKSAKVENISAELLRVNNIENFDTCKINFSLGGDKKASFIAAHPVEENMGPLFEYIFEKGSVYYSNKPIDKKYGLMPEKYEEYGQIVAIMNDGSKKIYGDPMADSCRKMHIAVEMALKNASDDGACGLEATAEHTKLINHIQKEYDILNINSSLIREKDGLLYAEGLFDEAILCYKNIEKSISRFGEK